MRCRQFESVAAHVIGDVYRIHAAFLARQVPTSGRRKTVPKRTAEAGRPLGVPYEIAYRRKKRGCLHATASFLSLAQNLFEVSFRRAGRSDVEVFY